MTTYKIILSIFSLIFGYQSFFAQTDKQREDITRNYNFKKLTALSNNFSETYKKDKRHAIAYALEHDIETIKTEPHGGISILEKVLDDGTLIYVSTLNAGAATTINTDQVYDGGSLGLSLNGNGINFGIWDGGIVRDTHQELVGRVVQQDNPNNMSSHATHVSGTMIATGINPNAKGMAFQAELTAYDFQNDMSEMTNEAMNGMLVSNHSYGLSPNSIPDVIFGAYLPFAANIDQLVFNAPNYLPVFAAGNSRNVPPSQGGPFNDSKNGFDLISGKNLAKNILCVANVLEVNNYVNSSSVVMSNGSSWGPTDDGRIKPDISAKGTNTTSSTANADDAYASFTGTSMAAPSVSGSIGLLHQHYNNMFDGFLNAASMKALIIHTAREAGNSPGPDYKFGWGLMNTAAAADVISNQNFTTIIQENTLNQSDTYSFTVDAVDANTPLMVTIAWTDPAGTTQDTSSADDITPRLVNDLDLRIIAPDGFTEIKPWTLSGLLPDLPAVKSDNFVDNIEKVEVDNAVGQYTIQVSHKGTLQNLAQDYSIIVSGIAESSFAIITDQSNKSICANELAIFDFDVNTLASFTGNINFSQSGLPSSLNTSFSPASLNGQGSTFMSIDNLGAVAAGNYPFTVTATSGSETFDFDMNLNIKSADALGNVNLNEPINNGQAASISPLLEWSPIAGASSYEVQLSISSNFQIFLFNSTTDDTQVVAPELDPEQSYFWRVRPISDCVTGSYTSSPFTTKAIECIPLTFSNDTPVNILSTGPNNAQSTVNISGVSNGNTLEDINVNFELTHTWLADLRVLLTSPDGTTITLLDQPCDDLDDIDVTFDDKGFSPSCNNSLPALSGVIKPQDKLSTFVGEIINGNWTLTVEDMFAGDGGSIDSFGIELCYEETLSIEEQVLNQFSLYPNPSSGRVEVSFDTNIGQNVEVQIFDINGRILKSFEVKNPSNQFGFDLSDLSSGVYFVKLMSQNTSGVKKLILK